MESGPSSGGRGGRRLLRQEVAEGIKRYILENRLHPGDPLPTEAALCEALDASRSSVREAVKVLDALDIVEVRHGHGTYVGRLSLSALVEGLAFRGLLSPHDDLQVLADLVDVRELFERGMAERIVATLSIAQLEELDALVARMRAAGDAGPGGEAGGSRNGADAFVAADRAFHALLVEPLGNALIGQLSMAFWDVYSTVAPHLAGNTHADETETIAAHQSIVDSARRGDTAGFTKALAEHYAPVRRRITESRATAAEGPQTD